MSRGGIGSGAVNGGRPHAHPIGIPMSVKGSKSDEAQDNPKKVCYFSRRDHGS